MEKYMYAGKKLKIRKGAGLLTTGELADDKEFVAEDYWLNVNGVSWQNSYNSPTCMEYAIRTGLNENYKVPYDDRCVYGKVGLYGHIFHEMELEVVESEVKNEL